MPSIKIYPPLQAGAYSGFLKGGFGRELHPKKIFSHPSFSQPLSFCIPPLLDLIGSVVWIKRCKKTFFASPPAVWVRKYKVGAKPKVGARHPRGSP